MTTSYSFNKVPTVFDLKAQLILSYLCEILFEINTNLNESQSCNISIINYEVQRSFTCLFYELEYDRELARLDDFNKK